MSVTRLPVIVGEIAWCGSRRNCVPKTCRTSSRVVARAWSDDGVPPDPTIGEVTNAVLHFHDTTTASARDTGLVSLRVWAGRYGWDVQAASKTLRECDVVTGEGSVEVGVPPNGLPTSVLQNDKLVNASDARLGLWKTHVFPDFCVQALCSFDEAGGITKRQVLDMATRRVKDTHPNVVPDESKMFSQVKNEKTEREKKPQNTSAAFADVLKSLRRRFVSEKESPVVVMTTKVGKKRVYFGFVKGVGGVGKNTNGWEVAFGELGDEKNEKDEKDEIGSRDDTSTDTRFETAKGDVPLIATMEQRRAKRLGTMRLAQIKPKTNDDEDSDTDAEEFEKNTERALDAARRARTAGW
jgi:hypothetical protein